MLLPALTGPSLNPDHGKWTCDDSILSFYDEQDDSFSIRELTGLWKTHYRVSQVLELLEQKQIEQGAATRVQPLKAIHQADLALGSWRRC